MTTLTATLSVAMLVFATSKILAAQNSEALGKTDVLECGKPEAIAAVKGRSDSLTGGTNDGANPTKVKRDVNSNLIPFPRVGRTYPHVWAPSNNYDSVKRFRNGLIPFPRVGRSGTGPKRNGAGGGGSLWFGPRLGKRTFDNIPDQPTLGQEAVKGDMKIFPTEGRGQDGSFVLNTGIVDIPQIGEDARLNDRGDPFLTTNRQSAAAGENEDQKPDWVI